MTPSGNLRALQCPQNREILDKGMAWWITQSFIVCPQYTASTLNFEFSTLYSLSCYLKSPLSNLNSPSSTPPPLASVNCMGYLTQNVLKIAGIPMNCQQKLAPLAAFSRFEQSILCVCCKCIKKLYNPDKNHNIKINSTIRYKYN